MNSPAWVPQYRCPLEASTRGRTALGVFLATGRSFFVLLASLALLACGGPLERGRDALAVGNYGEAVEAAREGLASEPDNARLRLLLAEAYAGQGRWRDAAEAATGALVGTALAGVERGRAHRVAGESLAHQEEPLEAALQALQARALGAWDNDAALRELFQAGVDQALSRRRPGDALVLLRELRELSRTAGADGPDARLVLATGRGAVEQLLELSAFSEALTLLGELIAEFQEAEDLYVMRGRVELRMGLVSEAEAHFDRYAGDRPERLLEVAHVMTEVQSWRLAAETYERVLALEPGSRAALLGLLEVQLGTARLDAARTTLVTLLASAEAVGEEALAQAYREAAGRLRAAGQGDWSLEVLEAGAARVASFEVVADLAEALERRERPARAEAVLRGFADASGARGAAAEQVGDWYLGRGAPARAALFYREASTGAGASGDIYLKLARAFAAIDYAYEVVAALDAWVEVQEGSEQSRRTAYDLLASAQLWEEAARVLGPVLEAHPDDAALRLRLGRAYWLAGEPAREESLYEAWVAATSPPGTAALRVARAYLDRGDHRRALGWLERAADGQGTRAEALLEQGTAHQMLSEWGEMWAAYDAYCAEADGAGWAYDNVLARLEGRRFAAEAAQLLERMVAGAPWRADLRLQLGQRLLQAGDPAAESAFIAYVLSSDDVGEAARSALWTMRHEAPPGMAERVLDAVSEVHPHVVELALVRARHQLEVAGRLRASDLERSRAHMAAARAAFRDYLAAGPTDRNALMRGAVEMDLAGLDDLAVQAYELALANGANLADIRRPYALALVRTGSQPERASELLAAEVTESDDGVALAVEAAGDLAENGHPEAAFELLRRAQLKAVDDPERQAVFRAGAELLAANGAHRSLVALSNTFVETSRDQTAALRQAAAALAEAGLWEPARERLELALARVSAGSELAAVLTEVSYGAGGAEAAVARLESSAGGAPEAWRAAGQFFATHHELEAAVYAWSRVAGRGEIEALTELGDARVRLGELDGGLAAFDEALGRLARSQAPAAQRRHVLESALGVLDAVGERELADEYLERALIDRDLRPSFLLTAADRAFARGRDARGNEMIEAYLEAGGGLADVVAVELSRGLRGQPVGRVRAEVLEGEPRAGAALLERFWDEVLAYFGSRTVATWVDQLEARGVTSEALQRRLAQALVAAGESERAVLQLAELAEEWPVEALWAATLLAEGGDDQRAADLLVRALAGEAGAGVAPNLLAQALAVMTVASGPELTDSVSSRLVERTSRSGAVLARLDWLLGRSRVADAVALFGRTLALNEAAGPTQPGQAAPLEAAVSLFGARGYPAEAMSLAEGGLSALRTPDERFRSAIRYAFEAGATARAGELIARYRAAAAGYGAALVALGETLVEVEAGRGEGLALLNELVESGPDVEARRALRVLLRDARVRRRDELAQEACERLLDRPGERYRTLLAVAAAAEEAGYEGLAARYYAEALRLFPLRPGPFAGWLRNAYASGDVSGPAARFETGPRPGDSVAVLLSMLETDERPGPVVEREARRLALAIAPGDFAQRAALARAELERGELDLAVEGFNQLDLVSWRDAQNRQTILAALVGVQHSLAVSRAVDTVNDPISDPESLRLAALILHGAGHELLDETLRAVVGRQAGRDALLEDVAYLAYGWGRFELARELAGEAVEAEARARLAALRAACALGLGEPVESALDALPPGGEGWPSDGLRLVSSALLGRGEVAAAEPLLRELAGRIGQDDAGAPVMVGLAQVLEVFEAAGALEAKERFLERYFPELRFHPEALGR